MSLLVDNIGELLTNDGDDLGGAAIVVDGDRIAWVGPSRQAPAADLHARPLRPRPAVCRSARIKVPSGAPSRASQCAMSSVDVTSSNSTTRRTPQRAAIAASSMPA